MLNKKQMKTLEELYGMATQLEEGIADIFDELNEKYESRSERWQESDRGIALYEFVRELEGVHTALGYMPCPSTLEV